jgi:undecaprenyl phosphate N,N'-diacetylbacillosamine 1-phosphate transferase
LYKSIFKPFHDFVFAFIGTLLLLPLLLIAIILLFLANNGNPFFLQTRPGKNGKVFKLIKLKTMTDKKDKYGNLLPDGERITAVGKFIRKTSLDEIPQLLNVLKGDMSLVGPRPLLVEYLPFYNELQKRRHEVKPGITGWAQVNGRNAISWQQKFELDIWYIENMNLLLDYKILFKTIKKVIKAEQINHPGHPTMPDFKGNKMDA